MIHHILPAHLHSSIPYLLYTRPPYDFVPKGILYVDRDGTLIIDTHDQSMDFIHGQPEALSRILKAGFFVAVVSNAGRYLSVNCAQIPAFNYKNDLFIDGLRSFNAEPNCVVYSTYHPHGIVSCYQNPYGEQYRKPFEGMNRLIREVYRNLNPSIYSSQCDHRVPFYMIGDQCSDMVFGYNIHARPILVKTGDFARAESLLGDARLYPTVKDNLSDAIDWILKKEESKSDEIL